MSIEAMKQALEALEQARGALAYVAVGNAETNPNLARSTCSHGIYAIDKVEPALREALAEQPAQQEPGGPSGHKLSDFQEGQWWLRELDAAVAGGTCDQKRAVAVVRNMLATAQAHLAEQPAQRKPLTRDQVKAMMVENGYDNASPQERADFINGLRHGEVAHGITKGGAA